MGFQVVLKFFPAVFLFIIVLDARVLSIFKGGSPWLETSKKLAAAKSGT